MITTAGGYRYLTPRRVAGNIVPAVDSTGAERVSRFEDAQYLVEMARERYHWTIGPSADLSLIAPAYETTGFPLTHELLSQLANAVHSGGTIGDFADAFDCALIAADADMRPGEAAFRYGQRQEYAAEKWRAGKGVARTSPAANAVPRVEELDTYRRLYRDLSNMKRYVLRNDADHACLASAFPSKTSFGNTHLFGPVQQSGHVKLVADWGNRNEDVDNAVVVEIVISFEE